MCGVLQWPPDRFWQATPYECSCAYVGWCKANGAGPWSNEALGEAEIDDWKRDIEEMKRRHPDTTRVKR